MESFASGSIVVDIGCGNGKYLPLNDSIVKVTFLENFIHFFLNFLIIPDRLRSEPRSTKRLLRKRFQHFPVRLLISANKIQFH